MQQLNGKGNDDSTENISGITDGHQNYQKGECNDLCIKKELESENQSWTSTSNLRLKIGLFTIFNCRLNFSVYFPVTGVSFCKWKHSIYIPSRFTRQCKINIQNFYLFVIFVNAVMLGTI